MAAFVAAFGSHVDDPVGAFDDFHVVFDDDEGVAVFDEGVEGGHEFADVVEMESGGGLVENEEGVGGEVAFAEEAGEFDALGFSSTEGAAALAESNISESDICERLDLVADLEV